MKLKLTCTNLICIFLQLSLADLAVFDIIQQISIMWGNAIMDYSVDVKHHYERVMEMPRVKSWLENRPKTDR